MLTERLKSLVSFDWIYTSLLTVGSILIGYYASQPDKGLILLILGIASVIIAFIVKYRENHESKIG